VICGKPVRITGSEALWFHCGLSKKWSAHVSCIKDKGMPET